MRCQLVSALALAAALAACGERPQGESADDFAARINGGEASGPKATPTPSIAKTLPQAASNGREVLAAGSAYQQVNPDGSVTNGITINADGTFELIENGQAVSGNYEWLPDGRRLRLLGITYRPIVLIADGAVYRLTNENVPLDDVTPDRMYSLGGAPAPELTPDGPKT